MITTERLIGDLQRGDVQAREELYRRYALRVLFLVRARMGPKLRLKEDSGDVAQEALQRSLAVLSEFRYASDGAFLAFLAKKVEQTIQDHVDHWKAQRRDLQREVSLHADRSFERSSPLILVEVRPIPRPDEILERREDVERLARALDALREENQEYWELVLAVNVEGRSFVEIAANHGSTADAVKQRSYRAKRALVRIYEGLEGQRFSG
ncbi:MAG: sigma-70 family RNA polymerase sigma factor [Pirellulales bacterium]